jgi:hypothetical protein
MFGAETVVELVNSGGVINIDEISADTNRTMLVIEEIDPGTYALVETGGFMGGNGVFEYYALQCLSARAPVYQFEAGRITAIRTDDYLEIAPMRPSDEQVLEKFATTRRAYPGIQGEVTVAAPGFISWPNRDENFGRLCAVPDTFSILP